MLNKKSHPHHYTKIPFSFSRTIQAHWVRPAKSAPAGTLQIQALYIIPIDIVAATIPPHNVSPRVEI